MSVLPVQSDQVTRPRQLRELLLLAQSLPLMLPWQILPWGPQQHQHPHWHQQRWPGLAQAGCPAAGGSGRRARPSPLRAAPACPQASSSLRATPPHLREPRPWCHPCQPALPFPQRSQLIRVTRRLATLRQRLLLSLMPQGAPWMREQTPVSASSGLRAGWRPTPVATTGRAGQAAPRGRWLALPPESLLINLHRVSSSGERYASSAPRRSQRTGT